MMADWGHRFDNVLPEMLAAGVRVMIYAGDQVGPWGLGLCSAACSDRLWACCFKPG